MTVLPFDQDLRRMTTIRVLDDNNYIVYTKGAPEYLLNQCTTIESNSNQQGQIELNENMKDSLRAYYSELNG